ncbi:MAG: DMT family transporter, partial [Kiloniellaceae bacterium]
PVAEYIWLVTLAAIWGASFLFIKVAVETLPPLTVVAGRLAIGAVGLLIYLAMLGHRLPRDLATWRDCAVLAVIGTLVPFALITWGEVTLDSGLAAILMAPMPLVSVLLAHVFTADERLSAGKLVGVGLGFAGIVVLVGPGVLSGLGREAVAQLAVAAAGCGYAASNVYTRTSRLAGAPPGVAAAGVLLCASLIAVPISLYVDRPWTLAPSAISLLSLLFLGVLATSAAYLILFRLIARNGAGFTGQINFLVPVFGVIWGALILAEALPTSAFAALGLILLGIAISQVRLGRKTRARADTDVA